MAAVGIRGLEKRYGAATLALKGIDLAVESGAFFTLLGPSGCGKTTLLRSIAGFLPGGCGRDSYRRPAHRRGACA